ncbi:MAG: sigma-54 dependent transcriptional regulator [Gammaproteobacteria bacterium]|nr:sigma-54 dependent transcriptional regulator [Gammaproteobacteria bacterium]MDH5800093.1 sigma-54 dependent transcriptional regulator [Gammaproteobacteria bacterium]
MNHQALIIDDEPDIRELLELTLGRMDVGSHSAANVAQAKSLLEAYPFDMCLTDMKLPDGNGLEIVQHIQKAYPHIPVAVITAHGNMEMAIQALKAGAFDFVSKPVDLQILRKLVNTALKVSHDYPSTDRRSRDTLLGESEAMRQTRATITKVARSQAPIYISGESGTGKEMVARLIHKQGPRRDAPFVPVNCGAIPTELMESEFFGHKKGSFTGASVDKEGLFQAADGGTLFLDEVADLPITMQVKLLRAIQEKSIRPIGATQEVAIDVRLLSATHKPLTELVAKGQFRQDLFYRINVIEVAVPPLRGRQEDIALLTRYTLERLQEEWRLEQTPQLESPALQALQNYSFPGNVRELENILERAVTLCEQGLIKTQDLRLPGENTETSVKQNLHVIQTQAPIKSDSADSLEPYSLEHKLEEIEKASILAALEKTKYNKTAAAKQLGMSFRSFRYRLKKLGLE